jgi:ribosomal protein S27AE
VGFEDRFCAKCGAGVEAAAAPAQIRKRTKPLVVVCPACGVGAEIDEMLERTACYRCGHSYLTQEGLVLAQRRLQQPPAKPPRRRVVFRERSSGASNDTLSLVMGILGLLMCPIFSVVAWVSGSPGSAGRILGIVGAVLWGLMILLVIAAGRS